jgi:hypothetical protein
MLGWGLAASNGDRSENADYLYSKRESILMSWTTLKLESDRLIRTAYSDLSATIGSTRVALRAGIAHAARATTARTPITLASTRGSSGCTP